MAVVEGAGQALFDDRRHQRRPETALQLLLTLNARDLSRTLPQGCARTAVKKLVLHLNHGFAVHQGERPTELGHGEVESCVCSNNLTQLVR